MMIRSASIEACSRWKDGCYRIVAKLHRYHNATKREDLGSKNILLNGYLVTVCVENA